MTSQTPDIQAVLKRLDRLERQNRWLRRTGALAVVAVSALLLMGLTGPGGRAISAEEFDLVDGGGRVRGKLGFDDNGKAKSPALDLYDANGIAVATLYASMGRTGGLLLDDADSGASISLITTALVGPELRLSDTRGVRVALSLWRDTGDVSLELSDGNGNRSVLGAVASGGPVPRETGRTSAASLVMFGKDGKVLWHAP
jgi:hypothetical protein